jgi:G3E family GTPase
MKGILTIAGEEQRFVFQSVHMLFDAEPTVPGKRESTKRLVFNGRNWTKPNERRFRACLV